MPGEKYSKAGLSKSAKYLIIIITVGMAYLFICLNTPFRLKCVFHEVTGLYCPGCGITRMFLSLFRLDFHAAFHYNPAVFITLLPLVYLCICELLPERILMRGIVRVNKFITIGLCFFYLAFGILRNIPLFLKWGN